MDIYMWSDGFWCEIDDLYLHRHRTNNFVRMTIGQANIFLNQVIEDLFPTIH